MVFSWRSAIWVHRRLPFGCRSACLHAQRVTEAVCRVHTSLTMYHVSGYVDDYLSINERPVSSHAHGRLHILIDDFGLARTEAKCVVPGDRRVGLGILYDMPARMLYLPEDKLTRATDLIAEWLLKDQVNRAQVESLVGFLNHVATVVQAGRPFNSSLYDLLTQDQFPISLDHDIKQDLAMWHGFLLNSFTRCAAMKRCLTAPVDFEVALAVKQNSCVIRASEVNHGYNIVTDWKIPISLMPAVAVWLICEHHITDIARKVVCVSVPSQVSARVINRVSTKCNRIRPMLRRFWLRQAQADAYVKAVTATSNVGWLYGDFIEFKDVKFPY